MAAGVVQSLAVDRCYAWWWSELVHIVRSYCRTGHCEKKSMDLSRPKTNFKLNLIVAVSENMGIGINGDLPWRLRNEMAYFARMTKRTKDSSKQNAVIMGRKTWESIPDKKRPLDKRINIVLSRQNLILGPNVLVCSSLETALQRLQEPPLAETVESAWVIGGSSVYEEAMALPHCYRIYLTKIFKTFECDTFLSEVPANIFKRIKDPDVPDQLQEENDLFYEYQVYERQEDGSTKPEGKNVAFVEKEQQLVENKQ